MQQTPDKGERAALGALVESPRRAALDAEVDSRPPRPGDEPCCGLTHLRFTLERR